MKPVLLILVLSFLCGLSTVAQYQIKGFIYTKDGEPIKNASILLHSVSEASKTLLSFSFADKNGFYILDIQNSHSPYLITVKADSYRNVERLINLAKDSLIMEENFILQSSVSFLDTVNIDLKFQISKTGDTLTFNPEAFSLKNETTIEQLLARLPGMEIAENGAISFNGSPVNRVLIDGDDLFKKNYQQLTQNAAPKIIDKIELIKNYQKDPLLKEFRQTNGQVINLTLKEKYKKYLFGNGTVGYGNESNKVGDLFLIKLSPKTKIQTGVNYNTTGIVYAKSNDFKPDDLNSNERQFFSYNQASPLLNIDQYYFPNIPMYYQQKNSSFQVYSNALFKKKGWESVLNAKYATDDVQQNQGTSTLYNDGTNLFSEYAGFVKNDLQEYNFTASKMSKRESMYFNTSLTNRARDYHLQTLSNLSLQTTQQLNGRDLMGQFNFSYFNKLKEGLLWSLTLGYFNQTIHGNLETSPDFLFWLFPNNLSFHDLQSKVKTNLRYTKLKSGLSFGKKKWRNEIGVAFTSENRSFISTLGTKDIAAGTTEIPFQNNTNFNQPFFSFQYTGALNLSKKNILNISVLNEPHFTKYRLETLYSKKAKFFYDYSIGISSKMRTANYNLTMGIKKQLPEMDLFYPNFIQNSFHNLESGLVDLNGESSTYFKGNYNITSLKLGLISFFALSISHDKAYFVNNLNTMGIGISQSFLYHPHTTNRMFFLTNSQKTLGDLPFHLKTNIFYFRNSLLYAFNDVINKADIQSLNAALSLKSQFKSVVNGEYTFSILNTKNKVNSPDKRTSSVSTIINKANLYLTSPKLFNTTITLNNISSKNISFNAIFLDVVVNKKIWKEKLLVELSARNIFDKKEISTQIISPTSIQQNSIRIRGSEFFVKIRYELR